jgi:AraC family transcriptional regulator
MTPPLDDTWPVTQADSFEPLSTVQWYRSLPAAHLRRTLTGPAPVSLHRFTGTGPSMSQPALREHVVAIHLGGDKRVTRWQAGRRLVADAKLGSVTLMPALQANRWLTEGPVDFAHIVVPSAFLAQLAMEEFSRDPRGAVLVERVGAEDPALSGLLSFLLRDLEAGVQPSRLYGDSFRTMFGMALLRGHTPLGQPQTAACHKRGGLAGWQLRRVLDRMETAIGQDTPLSELTGLTGLSRSQFFRAFRQSTGTTPHRYLTGLRMERAKALLRSGQEPTAVFSVLGYIDVGQFAAAFRRHTGLRPKEFLRATQ